MPFDAAFQTSFRNQPEAPSLTDELIEIDSDPVDLDDVKSAEKVISLTNAMAAAKGSYRNLLHFRRTWGATGRRDAPKESIHRAAHYPDSHIMHFSVLAGLVLFEGLANAYFFSKGSDLGLLGGWLQAITVSFTNVIAAFFLIGFLGMRHLSNPYRPINRVLAIVGIIVTALALIGLNLSAAHFRDLLEFNAADLARVGADTAVDPLTPVTSARGNPFGFETLEALLLFILGMTFAAIAAYKGRTFDDAIPGYGAATRVLAKDADQLEKSLTDALRKNTADRTESEKQLHRNAFELLLKIRESQKSVTVREPIADPAAQGENTL